MLTHIAACLFTGQQADLDEVCPEHGETACVATVGVPSLVSECVIPDFQCTADHAIPGPREPDHRS